MHARAVSRSTPLTDYGNETTVEAGLHLPATSMQVGLACETSGSNLTFHAHFNQVFRSLLRQNIVWGCIVNTKTFMHIKNDVINLVFLHSSQAARFE